VFEFKDQPCPPTVAVKGFGQFLFAKEPSIAALVRQRSQLPVQYLTLVDEAVERDSEAEPMSEAVKDGDEPERLNDQACFLSHFLGSNLARWVADISPTSGQNQVPLSSR
jgi:hypothetical protein